MDKGLIVPKQAPIVWQNIPQMPQTLSAQFVCPNPKVQNFNEERLHWASVVRDPKYSNNGIKALMNWHLHCKIPNWGKLDIFSSTFSQKILSYSSICNLTPFSSSWFETRVQKYLIELKMRIQHCFHLCTQYTSLKNKGN